MEIKETRSSEAPVNSWQIMTSMDSAVFTVKAI
jgi:hypothetical protein